MSETTARVLYAEDDPDVSMFVKATLARQNCDVRIAGTARDFRTIVEDWEPDLCLIDILLPDASGLDLLSDMARLRPAMPAIVLTKLDSAEQAIAAVRLGAADYLTKPLDAQRLSVTVRNALRASSNEREIERLRLEGRGGTALSSIVGGSEAMDAVRQMIRRAAKSDMPALILGESGTGKELVARALHAERGSDAGPLVVVNCAALSETLLESELFGHEKGAFTGSVGIRRGLFEQANGGAIFLDEIGDMPQATQAKILRVLQDQKVRRVGGEREITVNVRVICATNRDLSRAVEKSEFRRDLFYRINAITIEVPPLRSRREDLPLLAGHFLVTAAAKLEVPAPGISEEALSALSAHDWPGNVRELEHVIERAVLMSDGEMIQVSHLPAWPGGGAERGRGGLIEEVEALERTRITAALEKHGWVKARAARELGLTKRMIGYKIEILGIRPPGLQS